MIYQTCFFDVVYSNFPFYEWVKLTLKLLLLYML